MTDRLEELLRGGPPGEVDATGLAVGARARRRSHRQSRGAIALAMVAVAAVPLAMTFADDPQRAVEPAPPVASTSAPVVEDGTRTETWHRISLEVPDSWGYRSGCPTLTSGPDVGRPGPEGCGLRSGYGVTFGDGSAIRWVYDSGHVWQYRWESEDQVEVYPEDSWLGFVQDGDDYAMVVTASEALTRRIVASFEVVRDADANGCTVTESSSYTPLGVGGRWSVCRYDESGRLEQSELLSEADTAAFLDAIAAAPLKDEGPGSICAGYGPPPPFVRAGSGADLGTALISYQGCSLEHGVTLSGSVRELTPEILYWALSPGWTGSVGDGVPLPDQLRR